MREEPSFEKLLPEMKSYVQCRRGSCGKGAGEIYPGTGPGALLYCVSFYLRSIITRRLYKLAPSDQAQFVRNFRLPPRCG